MANIALITLVCGWLFAALAACAVVVQLWVKKHKHLLAVDDLFTLLALLAAVCLVAQTTWAILVEDESKSIEIVPQSHIFPIIKVCSTLCIYGS